MTFARKLNDVQNIQQQESAERAYGDQKVLVQQVSVSEGGQAIVGNITQAARETAPDTTSPPALTDARMAAMPIIGNQEPTPVALLRGEKDESST